MLKVDVYDSDSDSRKLEDHDHIGSCECSLGEVFSESAFSKSVFFKIVFSRC